MEKVRLNTKLISSLSNVLFIPAAEIIVASEIANSTYYRIMQTPIIITIQQLLCIANGLHVPVRRFFSFGNADIIGKREDYIAEPYQPCHYDEDALQEFVQNCNTATWKRAAEATGMSYSRLRNSLLAVTRTPVTRFLQVCSVFGINPFSILIDPNPEVKRKSRSAAGRDAKLAEELSMLRQDVNTLSRHVADLTKKYEELLSAHDALLRQINVNIHNFTDSSLSIAADPIEKK